MRNFIVILAYFSLSILIFCFSVSCGIPNYSPIGILDSSISATSTIISGDVISQYSADIRSDEPKICFYYIIAPTNASYLSNFITAFNKSYYSNTNLNLISYNPNGQRQPFLTANISGTEAGLYQFDIDSSSTEYASILNHKEAFISGTSDFTAITSDSLRSVYSFSLDPDSKKLIFVFTDNAGNDNQIVLKRYNDTVFSENIISDGSSYSGNELPAALDTATGSYSVYIYAAVEIAFDNSSFNNVLHSQLKRIQQIDL